MQTCHCACITDNNSKYFTDINECARRQDSCSDFAVCSNTIGSFNCVCFPGYQGDGTVCRGMLYALF